MKLIRRFTVQLCLLGILASFGLTGCETVPVSGRSRTMSLYSESELSTAATDEFNKVKAQAANEPEKLAALKRIGARLVEQARKVDTSLPAFEQWEFVVLKDDAVNAFAMPGGKVAFNTGIFPLFSGDEEIAVVMSHEVSHVIARHGAERMTQQTAAQAGGALVGLLAGGQSATTQELAATAYGLGAQYGALLPFSRKHESEADQIGLTLMARAGYNPEAAISFWQKMAAKSGGSATMELLSTHPSDTTRIAELKKLMPAALEEYKKVGGK